MPVVLPERVRRGRVGGPAGGGGAGALCVSRPLSSAPAQCAVSAQRSFVCICNVGTYRRAQPEGLPCQACACQAL